MLWLLIAILVLGLLLACSGAWLAALGEEHASASLHVALARLKDLELQVLAVGAQLARLAHPNLPAFCPLAASDQPAALGVAWRPRRPEYPIKHVRKA